MKILQTKHIREADQYTIENEPIRSVDLMERAAIQLLCAFSEIFPEPVTVCIFSGPGNNGGDGIALARMLADNNYPVNLYVFSMGNPLSPDSQINLDRLPPYPWLDVEWLESGGTLPELDHDAVIVDALFGSGLSRELSGDPARLITYLNFLPNQKVAIDIPSGLFGEDNSDNSMEAVFKADYTFSLHCPKFAMLMPEHDEFVGDWKVLDIGLDRCFVAKQPAAAHVITQEYVAGHLIKRKKFDHKGTYGHALLLAGSAGKTGAALLASHACLRGGVGLLTCHTPHPAASSFYSYLPEAMLSVDPDPSVCSKLPDLSPYQAVGVGPGLGVGPKQKELLTDLLEAALTPVVLDADALNLLATHPELVEKVPDFSILTPHPGEYTRLFGPDKNHYERITRMVKLASKHNIIIVLKGAHTAIALPERQLWFNNTGNPGMATAGSGDVLTGIILSLLAQGYQPEQAALIGVYIHGAAGDLACAKKGPQAMLASDIITSLGEAFKVIQ